MLRQIGVPFRVLGVAVDEAVIPDEAPEQYVVRLAVAKAKAGWHKAGETQSDAAPVLGADTAVVIDGRITGRNGHRSYWQDRCHLMFKAGAGHLGNHLRGPDRLYTVQVLRLR